MPRRKTPLRPDKEGLVRVSGIWEGEGFLSPRGRKKNGYKEGASGELGGPGKEQDSLASSASTRAERREGNVAKSEAERSSKRKVVRINSRQNAKRPVWGRKPFRKRKGGKAGGELG